LWIPSISNYSIARYSVKGALFYAQNARFLCGVLLIASCFWASACAISLLD
jgi:hypothetical protein